MPCDVTEGTFERGQFTSGISVERVRVELVDTEINYLTYRARPVTESCKEYGLIN